MRYVVLATWIAVLYLAPNHMSGQDQVVPTQEGTAEVAHWAAEPSRPSQVDQVLSGQWEHQDSRHSRLSQLPPREPAQWGWGWDELSAINPSLVMTSITPYGQTGPYRHFRGSELTLQALGGPLYTNGHESRYPLKLAGHFAHYHAGLMATVATLMALRRAEGSGHGDWIDLAVYECQAACRDRQCVYLTIAGYSGMSVGLSLIHI